MKKDILCRPFPHEQVRQRPGQHGKVLSYIETWAVIQRLNEGCDSWDFTIEKYEVMEGEVVVLGRLSADGVIKSAFGGSSVTTDGKGAIVSLADDLKSAASDALKKCATLLGVALELYGAADAVPSPAPAKRQGQGYEMPPEAERALERLPLTTRQLAAIHAASRRRGFSRERLAAFLGETVGKADVNGLSKAEASTVISALSGGNGVAH